MRTRGAGIRFAMLLVALSAVWVLAHCSSSGGQMENTPHDPSSNGKRILLLGASIGKAWRLPEYPQRMNAGTHAFESIAAYQFDKSEALQEILMRPKRKFRLTRTYLKGFFQPAPRVPDVIIIKECASYFPGPQQVYEESVKAWVKRIRDARVGVMLATVAPVTRERAEKKKGQNDGIWAFNEWIRSYAKAEGITVIDLEAVLRKSEADRSLNGGFDSGDGQHLNKKAYDALDIALQTTLERAGL